MRRIAVALVGFAGSALVAFFAGGPAMLADGADAERAWMVATASVAWGIVGTLAGWVAGSPRAGLSVAVAGRDGPPSCVVGRPRCRRHASLPNDDVARGGCRGQVGVHSTPVQVLRWAPRRCVAARKRAGGRGDRRRGIGEVREQGESPRIRLSPELAEITDRPDSERPPSPRPVVGDPLGGNHRCAPCRRPLARRSPRTPRRSTASPSGPTSPSSSRLMTVASRSPASVRRFRPGSQRRCSTRWTATTGTPTPTSTAVGTPFRTWRRRATRTRARGGVPQPAVTPTVRLRPQYHRGDRPRRPLVGPGVPAPWGPGCSGVEDDGRRHVARVQPPEGLRSRSPGLMAVANGMRAPARDARG